MPEPLVVSITTDVDVGDAQREVAQVFDRIERSADDTAARIERAFDGTGDDIGQAFDGVARDADRELERLARAAEDSADDMARSFDAAASDIVSDLDGAGREGERAIDRVADAVDDLDRKSVSVPIDARAEDLIRLDDELAGIGEAGGERAADGFESALGGVDVSSVGGSIAGQLSSLGAAGGPIGAIGGLAAAAFGDDFAAGINRGFRSGRNRTIQEIRAGVGAGELALVGAEAGEAYARGFGESAADVFQTSVLIDAELQGLDANIDLSQATAEAEAFQELFGVDIPTQIRLVQRLVANDLVDDTDEAFDLMFDSAQRFPLAFEEIFEVTDEFAVSFARLGVDGPQAFNLVGEAARQGLFPDISRAGEAFEEFAIRVTDGDSAEAIQEIGLSIEDVQRRVATGDGAAAISDVAQAISEIEEDARRATLANAVFGSSFESIADVDAGLELIQTADGIRAVGDAADDATSRLEENRSGFDRAQRTVESFAAAIGGGLNAELEALALLLDGDLSGAFNALDEGASGLASTLIDLAPGTDRVAVAFGFAAEEATFVDSALGLAAESAGEFGDVTGEAGDAAEDASESVDGLTESTIDLDEAMSAFADRFSGDQVFRSIENDIASLAGATEDLTAESFSLAEGFDISTEAGRKAESAAEDLSGNLDDLIGLYREGLIDADGFSAGQARIEAALREVFTQAGFTESQVDALLARYAEAPADVTTELEAIDNASSKIRDATSAANAFAGVRTATLVTESFSANGLIRRRAAGGDALGLTLVGEEGPELVNFGTQAQVFSTQETSRILDGERSDSDTVVADAVLRLAQVLQTNGAQRGDFSVGQVVVAEGSDIFTELDVAREQYEAVGV